MFSSLLNSALRARRSAQGNRAKTRRRTRPQRLLVLVVALALSAVGPASAGRAAGRTHGGDTDAGRGQSGQQGLMGQYFRMSEPGARDFGELGGTALDPGVDFPDLSATFRAATGRAEHVTARWTGRIEAPEDGAYTFHVTADDGLRLFLDGEPVIDHWEPGGDGERKSEPVRLAAGERHDIRLEMFQDADASSMTLSWSGPGTGKTPVPASALTPPEEHGIHPARVSVAADGRRVRLTLGAGAGRFESLRDHLTVEADTTAVPVKAVSGAADDPRAVDLTLGKRVLKDQRVRFLYDGKAGLTSGGRTVPVVLREARNHSAQRLTTEWGDGVDRDRPLPEYPRPQLERDTWKNLNGRWEFAGAEKGEQPRFGETLGERITVPYPVESQLSGVERHEDHMFYRRLVDVPEGWRIGDGHRLKLHFGAVDHEARVWVNGEKVAEHTGGYTAFSADITDALDGGGPQEIVVGVTDTGGDDQPKGKQTPDPGGIFYTQSSGIWQTVWMEPVAGACVDELVTTPDVGAGVLTVRARSARASGGATVTAVARDREGRKAGEVTGPAGEDLRLRIEDQHLWSPDDPYLYDLDVTLRDGGSTDEVRSYFGMRSIEVRSVGGKPQLVLNGRPFFSLAMLDQGFWPDGLHTAPSDDALRFDLEAQKRLGFNSVRKHIKAEPARWYHHADRLGLLVWQDFVSGDLLTERGRRAFEEEGREMMRQTHNSPSVGMYVPFNEGWGEWDREESGRIAEEAKKADPSRVVNAHSGVNCCLSKGDSGKGDLIDHHDYENTDPPAPDDRRAAVDGEHGGFTLRTPGHMWPGTPTKIYSGVADKEELTRKYVENTREFYLRQAGDDLSGSVYTQVTDLENELNGFLTYDRREWKVDVGRVRAVNREVIDAGSRTGG